MDSADFPVRWDEEFRLVFDARLAAIVRGSRRTSFLVGVGFAVVGALFSVLPLAVGAWGVGLLVLGVSFVPLLAILVWRRFRPVREVPPLAEVAFVLGASQIRIPPVPAQFGFLNREGVSWPLDQTTMEVRKLLGAPALRVVGPGGRRVFRPGTLAVEAADILAEFEARKASAAGS